MALPYNVGCVFCWKLNFKLIISKGMIKSEIVGILIFSVTKVQRFHSYLKNVKIEKRKMLY